MTILGIESSCDETSAAVVQKQGNRVVLLSNIVASSQQIHVKYGGVVPEQAAREQLKAIIPVIKEALETAQVTEKEIDAIAVTQGPGLIGSLLVGVETAKTLAILWNKPLIPVNHLIGHFYANWIQDNPPLFPTIGLLVSGGHTDIILLKDHGEYEYLGGTRDDAAGECFDKSARLLKLPYPGGPNLSKLATQGDPNTYTLPKPMWDSGDYDFSFSGLKTAVLTLAQKDPKLSSGDPEAQADLAAGVEKMIVDTLVRKVIKAAEENQINQIIVAGGVAANARLRETLTEKFTGKVFIPPVSLCTDNAATIASAALFLNKPLDPRAIQANPNLTLAK